MGQITGVAETATSRIESFGRRTKDVPLDGITPAVHGREADQVELSETAIRAGGIGETGVRTDLIERIRREIETGVYETPQKLDIAADRLARVLAIQS